MSDAEDLAAMIGCDTCGALRGDGHRDGCASAPFEPGPAVPVPPRQDWPHASIVRRSIAGDDESDFRRLPTFDNAIAASAASFDEGTPIRSSAAGWVAHGDGVGSHGTIGFGKPPDSLDARLVYALIVAEIKRVALTLPPSKPCKSGHVFSGPEQHALWVECRGPGVLSMHVIKGEVRAARKVKRAKGAGVTTTAYEPPRVAVHRVPERHQTPALLVSERLERAGIVATPTEIGVICRDLRRRYVKACVARGLVLAPRVSMAVTVEVSEMADPDMVEGWKTITDIVGRSENTCRKLASRPRDPLPISDYLGKPRASRVALQRWVSKHTTPWSEAG